MSSVEGFISSSPVSLSLVANSLDLMRKNHPTGHFGEYGTEVGLLFRGECDIKSNPNICSEIIEYGGEIFTKVLTRISNRKPVFELFSDLDLLNIQTNCLLAAQTSADTPIETCYTDGESNLVVDTRVSIAVCGYITWVLDETSQGKIKRDLATQKDWKGRDAHIFAQWVKDLGIKNACSIPTTTRCVALDSNLCLWAFRRDEREDGYVHKRPGIFMLQDEDNLFVTSTTVKALETLISGQPTLNKSKIRTVKNMETICGVGTLGFEPRTSIL